MTDKITSLAGLKETVEGKKLTEFAQNKIFNMGLDCALKLISEFEAGVRKQREKLLAQHKVETINLHDKRMCIDWFEHGILHGEIKVIREILGEDEKPLNLWVCEECGVKIPCGELLCEKCLKGEGER